MALVPAFTASAHAGTIESRTSCDGVHGSCTTIVAYKAAPGEANDISVTAAGQGVEVRDAGAPITAGTHCAQRGDHEVACDSGPEGFGFVSIDTGDGDDHVAGTVHGDVLLGAGDDTLEGAGVDGGVSGGPGDDMILHGTRAYSRWEGDEGNDTMSATGRSVQLYGGPGADDLEGGDGDDVLDGGPGADTVRGGPGNDVLAGDDRFEFGAVLGAPAADQLDGGAGSDFASYSGRTEPVNVDLLDPGPDGGAGEADRLISIEEVGGGAGADVLTGDGGANELEGGAGDDTISGRGGADVIGGGDGFDRLSGGAGSDAIAPGSGERQDAQQESVDCGEGTDVVDSPHLDVAEPSCELVAFRTNLGYDARFSLLPLSAGPRAATFAVPCPASLRVHRRCSGTLAIEADGVRQRQGFDVSKAGGSVTVMRPGDATRVLLTLRYGKQYPVGTDVYIDLPGADAAAPPLVMAPSRG